jgi:hypothetical protein
MIRKLVIQDFGDVIVIIWIERKSDNFCYVYRISLLIYLTLNCMQNYFYIVITCIIAQRGCSCDPCEDFILALYKEFRKAIRNLKKIGFPFNLFGRNRFNILVLAALVTSY